jgi:FixJ family two-component response regulator
MSYLPAHDRMASSAAAYAASMATRQGSLTRAAVPSVRIPATVFLIHEDPAVLQSLRSQIRVPEWQVETFPSAMEFLSRPAILGPHCLVLDVTMPGLKGLQKRLATDWIGTPIVLVRGSGDVVMMMVQARNAGAAGAMAGSLGDDLSSAIAHAIEHSEMTLRHEEMSRVLRSRYESLSRREREVMTLVATGLLNKQVAYELGISEITVKAHRGKAMQKMQARSIADLVGMAASLHLIDWQ